MRTALISATRQLLAAHARRGLTIAMRACWVENHSLTMLRYIKRLTSSTLVRGRLFLCMAAWPLGGSVCLSVCLSVCYAGTHFSSHRSHQKKLTYPAAHGGQKYVDFSEIASLQS